MVGIDTRFRKNVYLSLVYRKTNFTSCIGFGRQKRKEKSPKDDRLMQLYKKLGKYCGQW